VNKSTDQSQHDFRAGSRCTNRAVFYSVPAAGAGFILVPESMLHELQDMAAGT